MFCSSCLCLSLSLSRSLPYLLSPFLCVVDVRILSPSLTTKSLFTPADMGKLGYHSCHAMKNAGHQPQPGHFFMLPFTMSKASQLCHCTEHMHCHILEVRVHPVTTSDVGGRRVVGLTNLVGDPAKQDTCWDGQSPRLPP